MAAVGAAALVAPVVAALASRLSSPSRSPGLVAIATAHITLRDVDGAGVGTVVRTWVATVIASVVATVISAYVTVIANVGFAIVSAVRQAPCFCGLGANYGYCGNNNRSNKYPD